MKLTKYDRVFSQLVRERANWECEVCHKQFPEGTRQGLDTSHFFSRRRNSTRLHPSNAASMCRGCHQHMGDNPIIFSRWIEKHLGPNLGYITRLAHKTMRKSKTYKEEEYLHLKKELERMRKLRAEGETGRISFDAYGDDL